MLASAGLTARRLARVAILAAIGGAVAPLRAQNLDATTLLARARQGRLEQDSTLRDYEATARQRMSASIGLTRSIAGLGVIPLPRLAARMESVARVGWTRDGGAWGEIIGSRSVVPIMGDILPDIEPDQVALVLPYFPGRDRLWPISELRRGAPELGDWIVHPLDAGADSVYTFALGDSLRITLPDRNDVRLRELRVQPRRAGARLVVGSLWVDVSTGELVRAAYRPSVPLDLWPLFAHDLDADARSSLDRLGPYRGNVQEIVVEYALFEERFWLPRARLATAEGTASGARVTIEIEQTFEYDHVHGLPPGVVGKPVVDTGGGIDPGTGRVRLPTWYETQKPASVCRATGDTSTARWAGDSLVHDSATALMVTEGVPIHVLLPCDLKTLRTSTKLPPSIYATDELVSPAIDFAVLQREVQGSLAMSRQAAWDPQPVTWTYPPHDGLLRYNRVEGLSIGVAANRTLGDGYSGTVSVRAATGALMPLGELSMARASGVATWRASAYRRIASANDWGDPLGLGASLSAALFGRDDGFYYRTIGLEYAGDRHGIGDRVAFGWRTFGERQTTAHVATQRSLAQAFTGRGFGPNIDAVDGNYFGAAAIATFAAGADAVGANLRGNARAEVAGGPASYARGMFELTATQHVSETGALSLTAAAGSSLGTLPVQRWWYLGGPNTVHAEQTGVERGDAFWLGRAEIAEGSPMVRPVIFADLGWAGSRAAWASGRAPASAIGAGAAMVDNLIRLDVSRGVGPSRRWRVDFYFNIQ